jgi:hypothetical protein
MAQQWVHMARSVRPTWTTRKAGLGARIFRAQLPCLTLRF